MFAPGTKVSFWQPFNNTHSFLSGHFTVLVLWGCPGGSCMVRMNFMNQGS